ncbi:MAG: hypothetical protein R6U98_30460, partial [Pirellulaceae bacterium]
FQRIEVAVYGCRDTAWTRKTRMDATGLSRGGSRSPVQTGQTHHCCLSVAWNVTDHGTSPWHLHLEKPFVKCATNVRTPADISVLPVNGYESSLC